MNAAHRLLAFLAIFSVSVGLSSCESTIAGPAATLIGLEVADKKIQSILAQVNITVKNAMAELDASLRDVISQAHALFGDDFSHIAGKLTQDQEQFLSNAQVVLSQANGAIQEAIAGADAAAVHAIREADITAYNVAYSIPGRQHPPRLLYAEPQQYRDDGDGHLLRVRGNFLNDTTPDFTTSGAPEARVSLVGAAPTEVTFNVETQASVQNKEILQLTPRVFGDTHRACTFLWFHCSEKRQAYRTTFPVELLPRTTVSLHVHMDGMGRSDTTAVWSGHVEGISTVDRKDGVIPIDLPTGWTLLNSGTDPHSYISISKTQGSDLDQVSVVGNTGIKINYHSDGCHGFLGLSCGRGYLNVDYRIPMTERVDRPLKPVDVDSSVTFPTTTAVFKYPKVDPTQEILDLGYSVVLLTKGGNRVNLAKGEGAVNGVTVAVDRTSGQVSIQWNPNLLPK